MRYKRCECANFKECDHPVWVKVKRKKISKEPIRESLEEYFGFPVHGRGSWAESKKLETRFIADVDSPEGTYLKWKAKREAEKNGQPVLDAPVTITKLRDLYRQWIQDKKKYWGQSQDSFFNKVVRLWDPKGVRLAAAVTLADIETIISPLQRADRKPGYILQCATRLHRWLAWAERRKYIAAVPFSLNDEDLNLPDEGDTRSQLVSYEAEAKLRRPGIMPALLLDIFEVTYATVWRKGTLRKLQFMDIRWDTGPNGQVAVPGSKMKGRKPSVKDLTPDARAALRRRQQFYFERGLLKPETYVFGREDGAMYTEKGFYVDKLWRAAKIAAGLPTSGPESVTFHDNRATAACRYYQATKRLDETMRLLDHTDLKMTQKYLRRHLGELERDENVMANIEQVSKAAVAAAGQRLAAQPPAVGGTRGGTVIVLPTGKPVTFQKVARKRRCSTTEPSAHVMCGARECLSSPGGDARETLIVAKSGRSGKHSPGGLG